MLITLASVIVFSAVIFLLVLILTFTESKLVGQGAVKILINQTEDRSPVVNPGNTLLKTLMLFNAKISIDLAYSRES